MSGAERVEMIRTRLAKGDTLAAIGRDLGISRERVRQISQRAGIVYAKENRGGPRKMTKPYWNQHTGPRPETLRRVKVVRRLRSKGHTLQQIGDYLGIGAPRVWELCQRFNIPSQRDFAPKARPQVPPIDPEKAARITESHKKYWGMNAKAS